MHEILRRTFPIDKENGGPVSNSPARPAVRKTTLGELNGELARTEFGSHVVTLPILPHRIISIGGGRPIGGGTSEEALRRTRKHLARLNGSR